MELMDKWLSQAFSGLMAAVASKKIAKMPAEHQNIVQQCSKDAKDVREHAKCLVKLLDAEKSGKLGRKQYQKVVKSPETIVLPENPKMLTKKDLEKAENAGAAENNENLEWIGSFGTARAKRSYKVVHRDSYALRSTDDVDGMTKLAKSLTNTVRAMKNKTERAEPWVEAVGRIKKLGEEAKREKKNREVMKKRLKQMIDNTPAEFVDPRKPVALKQVPHLQFEQSYGDFEYWLSSDSVSHHIILKIILLYFPS